jgi:energy-coupling factor transporter transmembrane protein EcfT
MPYVAVPESTWIQIGIVVLFILAVLIIIYLLLRWLLGSIKSLVGNFNQVMVSFSELVTGFQLFISKRDEQWQSYMNQFCSDNRAEVVSMQAAFGERNKAVILAVDALKTSSDAQTGTLTAIFQGLEAMSRLIDRHAQDGVSFAREVRGTLDRIENGKNGRRRKTDDNQSPPSS